MTGPMAPRLGPGPAVLAFDVGGTDIKAAAVDASGTVSAPLRIPTPAPSGRIVVDVLDALERAATTLRNAGATPEAVGLALPGVVDDECGTAVWSENLGWRDIPFRALAQERLGLPVALVHDVRASALAELRLGAAVGRTDVLVVTVGTGIAAGVVVGGRVLAQRGYAGEIGHAVVRPDGEPCVCGNSGCLEATASAAAIARRYAQATGMPVPGARDVLARVGDDPAARGIWDDAVDALALGLSHACAALAPEAIVVAGGLSEAGAALLGPLQDRLDDRFRLRRTPVVRAELGGDAGVVGAALHARDALHAACDTLRAEEAAGEGMPVPAAVPGGDAAGCGTGRAR